MEDYWPLVALSFAVLVGTIALGFKGLAPTSYAVLDYLHHVNHLEASVAKRPVVPDPWEVNLLLGVDKRPSFQEITKHRARAIEQFRSLSEQVNRSRHSNDSERRSTRFAPSSTHGSVPSSRKTSATPLRAPRRGAAIPPAEELMVAACRDGMRLACLDQLDSSRWKSIEQDIAAELEERWKRPFWQATPNFTGTLADIRFRLGKLEHIHGQLDQAIPERRIALAESSRRKEWHGRWGEDTPVPKALDLSLAGAFAFWLTVGLLAAWSIRNHALVERNAAGVRRCFWARRPGASAAARESLRRYHDEEHGRVPRDDRELLERLALEILVDDESWHERDRLRESLAGLSPDAIAALEADRVAVTPKDRVEMVIENARRLQALYRDAAPGVTTGARRIVLDEWLARTAGDPDALVSHIRNTFRVPTTTPLISFLQTVGLIEGAHFERCDWSPRALSERRVSD